MFCKSHLNPIMTVCFVCLLQAMMKEWEHKVNQLQKEKEELSATLSDARSNANTNK